MSFQVEQPPSYPLPHFASFRNMTGQQKALWLEKAQGKFVVGPKHIDKPGHGELLVKIEATALNPVSFLVIATRS
jgi:hypothetical protein